MPTEDDLLTISQAARRLEISTWTIRRWANAGKVPVLWTPSGHRRFRRTDIEAAIVEPRAEAGNATALVSLIGLLVFALLLAWGFVTLVAGIERVGSVTDDRLGTTSGLVCEANGCVP